MKYKLWMAAVFVVVLGVCGVALAEMAQMSKESLQSGQQYLENRKRHYFNRASDKAFDHVKQGMTQAEVRKLSQGSEYLPFETVRGGFTIAMDEKRSSYFKFPDGWMPYTPTQEPDIDFIFSNQRLLYVRYDENQVAAIRIFPLKTKAAAEKAKN